MAGAIFYPEPPPQQPRRFVPIPVQGDQPPRRTVALMSSLVLASWPTGFEHAPQQRFLNVAPLTLIYGQQPPSQVGMRDPDLLYSILPFAWQPPDPLPTIPQRTYDAPLSLVYGDQPPFAGSLRDPDLYSLVVGVNWIPPDPPPQRDRRYIVPLTLAYGDQPPVAVGMRDPDNLYSVLPFLWQPPDPLPTVPQRGYDVPLTLTYGDQPPRPKAQANYTHWLADPSPVQPQSKIAPLTVVVVVAAQPAFTTYPYTTIQSWQGDSWPTQARRPIAPLTLAYGDQPPRYTTAGMNDLLATWLPPDPAPQRDPKRFAPLALIYGDQPPRYSTTAMAGVLSTWIPPDPAPQRDRKQFAPLTLVYGQQPPPRLTEQISIRSWQVAEPLTQQRRAGVAAIVPTAAVFVPFSPYPWLAISQWQSEPPAPARPAKVAPLALVYGDQPPRFSTSIQSRLVSTWEVASPVLQRASVHTPIFVGNLLMVRRRAVR